MEKDNENSKIDEVKEDKLIEDAFQHLLNTYLASPHRKKVDIITKAYHLQNRRTKECVAFQVNLTSYIL